jgi:hypothetical protein
VDIDPKLHKLLVKYKDLFRNGIGCLTQKKATLSIKPQSTPKFIKARPIPFAMRPKVEKELEKLERDGSISKIIFEFDDSVSWEIFKDFISFEFN